MMAEGNLLPPLKRSQSEMRGVTRFRHATDSSKKRFHDRIISGYGKDVMTKNKGCRQSGQVLILFRELAVPN